MSPRRFVLEMAIFLCGVFGAVLGFYACPTADNLQIVFGLFGFAVLGGFADFCLRK